MTGLEMWLSQATRHLAQESSAQVRREIEEHFQSALDAALTSGATAEEADRIALSALGDAKTVNSQYRQVLLTSAEVRMLRDGNAEARAICARPWLKRTVLAAPVAAMAVTILLVLAHQAAVARDVFIVGVGLSPLFAALVLPINTPSRGRVFRRVKWVAMTGALILLFGREAFQWSWLLFSCLWPLAWMEWTRASIRRKLPVAAWPRQLFL